MNISHLGRDPLALTILALLMEQPRHPYEIQRLIRERKKDFAYSSQRALYHAIERLVKAELILPLETNREGNRPERTIYQMTDEGRDNFIGLLGELLARPLPEYPLFTAAISFLAHLPMETALQALQTRSVELEGELASINARLQGLQQSLHRLLLLELEYIRALRQGELAWIHALLQDIRDGRLIWDADAVREHPESLLITPEQTRGALRLLDERSAQSS